MHTQCWGCGDSQLIKCLLPFAEERWAVHSHSAGRDAARHRIWNEVPVWHGLRTQRFGRQEYPNQQQLSLQGVRLRPLQSPGRWPRSSVHNQGELWGYWMDDLKKNVFPATFWHSGSLAKRFLQIQSLQAVPEHLARCCQLIVIGLIL